MAEILGLQLGVVAANVMQIPPIPPPWVFTEPVTTGVFRDRIVLVSSMQHPGELVY